MGIVWIYEMSHVHTSIHPSVHLAWQKLLQWTLHANCLTKFFHTCHAYRHH